MGYVKFLDAGNKETIIDASKILSVRLIGGNTKLDLITGFHTVVNPTTGEIAGGVLKQIRLVGTGFTDATLERMNLAIINSQVNLVTDFEFADGEALQGLEFDPHPN